MHRRRHHRQRRRPHPCHRIHQAASPRRTQRRNQTLWGVGQMPQIPQPPQLAASHTTRVLGCQTAQAPSIAQGHLRPGPEPSHLPAPWVWVAVQVILGSQNIWRPTTKSQRRPLQTCWQTQRKMIPKMPGRHLQRSGCLSAAVAATSQPMPWRQQTGMMGSTYSRSTTPPLCRPRRRPVGSAATPAAPATLALAATAPLHLRLQHPALAGSCGRCLAS
mmetsp:Transcript_144177/g.375467  ORF Transcript_144177/g.375467 Transcript_144177/m.375467 type:complete len:218 (+) Transcript_144177:657-1310(+)